MNNPSTETTNVWASRVARIDPIGHAFLRYGLVLAIGWIAGMKGTEQITEETIPMKLTWHGHSAFRIEARPRF